MGHGAAYIGAQDAHVGRVRHRAVRHDRPGNERLAAPRRRARARRELYAPFGVVPLASGNSGVQLAGWFNKEINSVADIDGLKMRIPASAARSSSAPAASRCPCRAARSSPPCRPAWSTPRSGRTVQRPGVRTSGHRQVLLLSGWHEPGATLEAIVNAEALATLPETQDSCWRPHKAPSTRTCSTSSRRATPRRSRRWSKSTASRCAGYRRRAPALRGTIGRGRCRGCRRR